MNTEDLITCVLVYFLCGAAVSGCYDEDHIPAKSKLQFLKNTAAFFFWPIVLMFFSLKKMFNYWTQLPDE